MMKYDIGCLNSVYQEIAKEIGIEAALRLFNMYKGTQVAFPTKLLSADYTQNAIIEEYDGKNVKELAVKYNYSERTVRRILKESG